MSDGASGPAGQACLPEGGGGCTALSRPFQGSKGGRPGYGIVRRRRACFYDAAFRLHNRGVPLYGPVFRYGGAAALGEGASERALPHAPAIPVHAGFVTSDRKSVV